MRMLAAVSLISRWWGRRQLRKRVVHDVGMLLRLNKLVKPWVTRAREVVQVSGHVECAMHVNYCAMKNDSILVYWNCSFSI
jgi:hypothetical protein